MNKRVILLETALILGVSMFLTLLGVTHPAPLLMVRPMWVLVMLTLQKLKILLVPLAGVQAVSNAIHNSSGAPTNGGTQSVSSKVAGSSVAQATQCPSDPPVDSHPPAQVVQPQSGQPLQTDNKDVFVDSSEGSDIED